MKLDAARVAEIIEESLLFYEYGGAKAEVKVSRGQPGILLATIQLDGDKTREFEIQVQETNWLGLTPYPNSRE